MEVSRKVTIKVKVNKGHLARLGKDVDAKEVLYGSNRIGSSFAPNSKDVLRGLTREEEIKLLPSIVGVSPSDDAWLEATKKYWSNISYDVPYSHLNNVEENGEELEVGFYYKDEEAKKAGIAEEQAEWNKYKRERENGRFYKMSFKKRLEGGIPLNVSDFILYRYCLVYSRVANTKEEINNSPKIAFFLESDAQRSAERKARHDFTLAITTKYIELISDREKVENILYIIGSQKESVEKRKGERFSLSNDGEKDIFIKAYSEVYPQKFIELMDDKRLKKKAFIQRCIDSGILRKLPNTQTIMYEDDVKLGDNMEQACDFISLEKNKGVVNEIKERLKAIS